MSRAEYDINERIARTDRHNVLNRVIDAERPYDFISMIFEGEMPIHRNKPYKDSTAICFHCMKLMHVNVNLGSKASQFDLIKDHYNYECSRPQTGYRCSRPRTEFRCARVIQRLWKNFRERKLSNAQLAWNSLPNNGNLDDEKLLGLMRHKVKNPQIREQFDQWCTKWITMYKQCNLNIPLDIYIRKYEEYYIPYN
ncbi:12446_t:CDS:2 [Cetraspora pellucida]|uniref:12446_t:CDS:1 n=1 Tax=Cetraspora pellucida TaxID=1433469 RepID=A0A9N8ZSM5_9GLOM|nr:12446_t:CDS:2 [Cetraspora pellucida]